MTENTVKLGALNEYKLLGSSGLRVSPLCLGTMGFGENWASFTGDTAKSEAFNIFKHYIKQGGNFIDTANKYQNGQAEEWIGEFIQQTGCRDEIVLASKYSLPMKSTNGNYNINLAGNHRKNLFSSLETSLKRLNTTYLDLFYVHYYDFTTSPEEIMRALDDVVRMGKVHYIGISDTPAWAVAKMNTLAEERGWSKFVVYQGKYNIGERDLERDIIPMSNALNLGVIPWAALGQGKYVGKYTKNADGTQAQATPSEKGDAGRFGVKMSDKDFLIQDEVVKIAGEVKRSPAQVCLNWILQQPGIVSPLIGVRKVDQLIDDINSLSFKLNQDQMARLNKISSIDLGWPMNFLGQTSDSNFNKTTYQTNPWLKEGGTIV